MQDERGLEFNFDEENLIEIDISLSRYKELSNDDEVFSDEISCNECDINSRLT